MVNPLTHTQGGGKESEGEKQQERGRERERERELDYGSACLRRVVNHTTVRGHKHGAGLAGRQASTQVIHTHRQQRAAEGAALHEHLGACWRA